MTSPDMVLASSYDYLLVALSATIAILASYAALDLAGRVTAARGKARLLWLSGGAIAMGFGIWSMHYIGMLAFRLPVPVQYDWPTVLLSLLAAVLASAVALFVVSRHQMGVIRASLGSILMGGGIAAMHYIGMAAMRLPAMCRYSPSLFILSIALAIVISFVALWLTFYFRTETTAWSWRKAVSALVMGAAIPVMHYTGMAAATFTPSTSSHQDLSHAVSVSSLSVVGITIVTLMVLGLVLLTSLADRRFSIQALELESSRRHHQIIETALDAFVEMDSDGLITNWNARAETTFGWSRSEAIGQALSKIIIPNQYREAHTQGLRCFLATGEGPVLNKRIEITALHRDGSEFPIELAISSILWGKRRLFAAFVRDVTERKRAEQELARRAEELARSNADLEQFAYVASHDLQEPLRMVASYTQLLARRYKGKLDADADEFIGFAVDGATRMQHLIQDLLSFSRVTTKGKELQVTDSGAACDQAVANLRAAIAESGAVVTTGSLPTVRADATQLTQLFQNLIGNAIKYRNERTPEIQVAAALMEDRWVFSVQDNGIGIERQYFERIFQMFQRLHTRKQYTGTGVGLAICRKIAERHAGRIWVESQPGKGSTFLFTIPRAEGESNEFKAYRNSAGGG
jgi:two-component system sensor histidine kinase/response regulator